MTDIFEFTLNNPLTEEQWDQIDDVDFDHTDRIWFHTKHGKEVEFAKVRYGKWIDGYILDEPIEVCSECNTFYMLKFSGGGMRYCPNCSARMVGE